MRQPARGQEAHGRCHGHTTAAEGVVGVWHPGRVCAAGPAVLVVVTEVACTAVQAVHCGLQYIWIVVLVRCHSSMQLSYISYILLHSTVICYTIFIYILYMRDLLISPACIYKQGVLYMVCAVCCVCTHTYIHLVQLWAALGVWCLQQNT